MSETIETRAMGGEVVVTSAEVQQGRVLAVAGYIIPLVALIVCLTRPSAYHGYHGRQALMVMLAAIAASVALVPVNIVLSLVGLGVLTVIVSLGYMIVFLGLVVAGCINAWNGRQQPLPVIGTFAERLFGRFGG